MRMIELIEKKKRGDPLTREEISFLINGVTEGAIPDYQISAFLMAVYFNGMSDEETAYLTSAMASSGDQMDLSPIPGIKVDKHSTGGVGDKISLIIAPLVASIGIPFAKMSGRGLGHTGGTLDKLESIPGFHIFLSPEEMIENVKRIGLAIVGQTANLVPADKKLYALRDVTGTVNSIPLIAASIMSKKIASGADAILLDVKVGSGAFMKRREDAIQLATLMVHIGNALGKKSIAYLTNMDEPLGFEVGNANEIAEVVRLLKGDTITDLREISLALASQIAVLGGKYADVESARATLEKALDEGLALQRFRLFVEGQGGDPAFIDDPSLLPQATMHQSIPSEQEGYITAIDAEQIGIVAMRLGAGREKKEDPIDHAAGITLNKKIGDKVRRGESLGILHSSKEMDRENIRLFQQSFRFGDSPPVRKPYIHQIIPSAR